MFLPAFSGRAASSPRGLQGGTGGEADQDALLGGGAAGEVHRVLGGGGDDLVDDVAVEDLRDEVGADALDLVRAEAPSDSSGESAGSTADDLDLGLALLEDLTDTGDGPAGADAADEDVDATVGVVPDLLGGGATVDLDVGRVRELGGRMPPRSAAISSALATAPLMPSLPGVRTSSAPYAAAAPCARPTWSRAWSARPCSRGPRRPAPGRCRCCRTCPRRWCRRAAARRTPRPRR